MVRSIPELLASRFDEVSPEEFYRDLFPAGSLDAHGAMTKGKYAGFAVRVIGKREAERYNFFDDLELIPELISTNDFIVIPPVSYAGSSAKQCFARELYAVAFDVDGIIFNDAGYPAGLQDLIYQMTNEFHHLPLASYIVSSGTGVHLYYLLDKPIRLFTPTMKQLADFRANLTRKIWNRFVTTLAANPQYESVTQGFRAVGSITKDRAHRVRAFRVGERVTLDYLNGFVEEKNRVVRRAETGRLEEAKEKYPEWYERRIVQGQPRGTWTTKPDLYFWWLRKIREGASVGHRYFCVMALAIYARKSGIPREQLERDAFGLIPFLDSMTEEDNNHFDESDVYKALEAYKATYITFPRAVIERLTGISIPPNKRNGRTKEQHVQYLNGMNSVRRSLGEEFATGRPSKKDEVLLFASMHPEMNKSQMAKALGVARGTIYRWLAPIEKERAEELGVSLTVYRKMQYNRRKSKSEE